jgi:iron(III) transport system substrate-binding protein
MARRHVAFAVAGLLVLSACGGAGAPGAGPPVAETAAGSELEGLIAGAKAEGAVAWADGLNPNEAEPIIKAFQEKYPFVKVTHAEVSGTDSRERLFREVSTGVVTYDVFDVSGEDIPNWKQGGLLVKYDWTKAFAVRPEQLDVDQMLLAVGGSIHGIGYNTNLVKGADIPKAWADLLDPKWKGKLVFDSRPKTFTALVPAWGEAKVLDFVTKLQAQQPKVRRGQTQSITLMGAGEFPIIAGTYNHSLYQVKLTGAPVDIVIPDPVPVTLDQEVLPKGVKHPNAAKLFLGWLATDGAKVYDESTLRGIPLPGFDTRPAKQAAGKQLSLFVGEWAPKEAALQKKILDAMGIKQ